MARAATQAELRWLEERTGAVLTPNARGIAAVDDSGVRGVVAFDGWTPNAVQAHMAVDTPVAWRALLRPTFEYPFNECDRKLLLGIIPADNARSVRMTERLGFRLSYRVADGWADGVDLLVFQMRRGECRWLGEKLAGSRSNRAHSGTLSSRATPPADARIGMPDGEGNRKAVA